MGGLDFLKYCEFERRLLIPGICSEILAKEIGYRPCSPTIRKLRVKVRRGRAISKKNQPESIYTSKG